MTVQQNKIIIVNNMVYENIYHNMRSGRYEEVLERILDFKSGNLKFPFEKNANHAWYCVGDAYFKLGKFSEALKAFQRAKKSDSSDAMCFLALGNSYDALGRPKLAERMFRKALNMDLDEYYRASAFFNFGNALYDQKRYEEAIEIYNHVRKRKDLIGEKARRNIFSAKLKINNEQGNKMKSNDINE
ncbi:tetratricopeptide repeat protein [Comamonas composti]|uniref:tetratricopeptide repeat protein n=1 Tax=Comamonas composti TaxID=408558 RepID=UPI000A00BE87|nr:tetratricopeptide repeat protein [Comamonas composti]